VTTPPPPLPSIVAGTDAGTASAVRAFRPDQSLAFGLAPFEPTFLGGVHVGAGDVTGDGVPDVLVAPGTSGGPRVQVYDGHTGAKVLDQFAYNDPNFRGGGDVAAGDFNGDGHADIVFGTGNGGGPRVTVLDGANPTSTLWDFFAFDSSLRGGVHVAA